MEYTPRGTVKKILDGMREHDANLEWTLDELAELGGIPKLSVTSTLRCATQHGVVFAQRRGQANVYSLTSYEPEPEKVEFNAAAYLDGDVIVWGAQVNQDDSVTFTREQFEKLRALVPPPRNA